MDGFKDLVLGGAALCVLAGAANAVPPGAGLASGSQPLSTLLDPPAQIADASIADQSGRIVGAMQRVNLANGKPTSAEIALLGAQDHLVVIDAAQMTYDASSNIVTVEASGDQLKAMPAKG